VLDLPKILESVVGPDFGTNASFLFLANHGLGQGIQILILDDSGNFCNFWIQDLGEFG